MSKNKISKNSREFNINNTIKSILLSDREVNHTNLKFSILKEILLGNYMLEMFQKKTFDFRKLIVHYKIQINECIELESAEYYFKILEDIRISRINTIIDNGEKNLFLINKLKKINQNEELEQNWIDRGYTHIKLINGTIEVKIEELTQLNYIVKSLESETINNIVTSTFNIEKDKINAFLFDIKKYALDVYKKNITINKNIILVGKNENQLEKIFLYFCLTDGKIHIVKRIKYFKIQY